MSGRPWLVGWGRRPGAPDPIQRPAWLSGGTPPARRLLPTPSAILSRRPRPRPAGKYCPASVRVGAAGKARQFLDASKEQAQPICDFVKQRVREFYPTEANPTD